jgi:hypothetical protein
MVHYKHHVVYQNGIHKSTRKWKVVIGMADEAAVKVEESADEEVGEAAKPAQAEQLEFDFLNQVADGVWDAKVEMRKKGLKMVLQGFAMIGCLHAAVSSVLTSDRALEALPELKVALEEDASRKKK